LDYSKLLDDIADAAQAAGEAIINVVRAGFDVEHKSDRSPVTAADRAAELIILGALAQAAPGVPVIAEEEVAAGRIPAHGSTYFLVDPLDGVRARQHEDVVVALQGPGVIGEALAPVVVLVEAELLRHRAHRPVQHQDALGEQPAQDVGGGVGTHPSRVADGGRSQRHGRPGWPWTRG